VQIVVKVYKQPSSAKPVREFCGEVRRTLRTPTDAAIVAKAGIPADRVLTVVRDGRHAATVLYSEV
jgi:hypothetical protein